MYKKTKKLVENYFWLQIMAVFNFKNASFSSLILLRALDYIIWPLGGAPERQIII